MKRIQKQTFLELLIFSILSLGVVVISQAQDAKNNEPTRVKVEVEVTENGETSSTSQEIELDIDDWNKELETVLQEMEITIREAVKDIEDADLEIIIQQELDNLDLPDFQSTISAVPDIHFEQGGGEDFAFLGVEGVAINEIERANTDLETGVRISKVVPGSAAEAVGLRRGMIITSIDGEPVSDFSSLADAIKLHQPKDEIKMEVYKDGKLQKKQVVLGARKSSQYNITMEWDDEDGTHRFFYPDRHHAHKRGMAQDHPLRGLKSQHSVKKQLRYQVNIGAVSADEIDHISKQSGELLDRDNALEPSDLTIAPNPSDGVFMINLELEEDSPAEIMVFDAQGNKVHESIQRSNTDGYILTRIDLTNQPAGMYFLSIMQEGKGKTERLVKQ